MRPLQHQFTITKEVQIGEGNKSKRGRKKKIKIRRGSSRGEKNVDLAQLPLELSAPLATTTTGVAQRGAVLRPSSKFLA